MKRLLLAIALTCVLSGSVLAGDMPTCGAAAPAPAPSETQSSAVVAALLTIISLAVG
ncbi:MAG: hypothetical protein QOF62_1294 [Pyrinomonadaceae bacterium]|jgi:hypothetical protein|nr:hypothetical protein [Pyrinomonadaceae bacterium]